MCQNNNRIRSKDELFDQGIIFDASDEELKNALKDLSTGNVSNETVRHREIIRGITINTIINQRYIDKLEYRNQLLSWVIIALTTTSIILSIIRH